MSAKFIRICKDRKKRKEVLNVWIDHWKEWKSQMNSLMSVLYHKIVIQYIYDLFGLMSGLYHKIVNQYIYIYQIIYFY
jgi:hypothetical protein